MQTFSKKHTDIAKGVACLLLLIHHLFYNSVSSYDKFTPLFSIKGVPLACVLASPSKVCVAMFLILSGYGVAASLNKRLSKGRILSGSAKVSARFILKLLLSLSFVFLLFVPWQGLMGHWPYKSWYHIAIDFIGLADLFGTPTINATWWYVTIALICYALTPVLMFILKRYPALSMVLTLCVYIVCEKRIHSDFLFRYMFWVCNYFLGMLIYEYGVFNRVVSFSQRKIIYRWIVCLLLVGAMFWLRINKGISMDPMFAVAIIVFATVCLYQIPIVSQIILTIGKHSGNIFLMHTFIYLYNFESIIYFPKYAPLIYLLCMSVCVFLSVLIEWIKRVSKFNYVSDKLLGYLS